jgi:hypothetical protein
MMEHLSNPRSRLSSSTQAAKFETVVAKSSFIEETRPSPAYYLAGSLFPATGSHRLPDQANRALFTEMKQQQEDVKLWEQRMEIRLRQKT